MLFSLEIPFHLPHPVAATQEQNKIFLESEKIVKDTRFAEKYYSSGNEPFFIVSAGKKKTWRGFLKLCRPDSSPLGTPSSEVARLIQLFRDESFGHSVEESRIQFAEKMRLTLLLNRVRSLSSTRNDSLLCEPERVDGGCVLILKDFGSLNGEKKRQNALFPLQKFKISFSSIWSGILKTLFNFLSKKKAMS
jgi:hypothetical protein